MAALTAASVTVSISQRNIEARPGFFRRVFADLTFGDAALTYPSGGIPLPAKEQFGFLKSIVFGQVEQPANGFFYKFDRTNHKLLMYTQGFVTVTTGTTKVSNPVDTLYYLKNSAGATTLTVGVVIPGASVATTTWDTGPLIELPVTVAPAAVTVRLELIGE